MTTHDRGPGPLAPQPPVMATETHISCLFFTPERVYKLLKPVRTGFLDHADRERRIAAADAELALNRRIAPDVYLGSADVVEGDELVDRMVVMRRLPSERSLARRIGSEGFDDDLRTVAKAVAAFHEGLPPVYEPVPLATATGLAGFWRSSFDDMRPFAGAGPDTLFDPDDAAEAERLALGFLQHHGELFAERQAAGFVRDGHGDLIAADVFMCADGPRILDCLGFDRDYRVCDVLADIAFLVMDVEHLAGTAAASRLLAAYVEFTNEHHPDALAHHYIAYRAHVRAKVAALRFAEGDRRAAVDAAAYHQQALDHLVRARPTIVLLGGGPGTGKTALTTALSGRTGWVGIDSDTLRKDLHRIDHLDHDVRGHPELYGAAATEATYGALIGRAERVVAHGESAILDATWRDARHRRLAAAAAARCGARLIEVECVVDTAEAARRIGARGADGSDVSDATPALVASPRDPWPGAARLDTTGPVGETVDRLVALAIDPRLSPPPGGYVSLVPPASA